jgi:hypothetical protein
MNADKLKFLTALLEYPEETAVAEYKSAVVFDSKAEFAAKLIKHIFGMANTGGGHIIIGFREDSNRNLIPDSNITDLVCRSFETTSLSQSVDSFLARGQRIELQVHKIQRGEQTYPVIAVQGFKESPYFCGKDYLGSSSKRILQEGAIYVRDLSAKTVVVAGPEHWNEILRRAVDQKQTELVEHLRSLLGQLGLGTVSLKESAATDEEVNWFSSESQNARSLLAKAERGAGIFEVQHHPVGISTIWTQPDLLVAAEKSIVRKTGWPIGLVMQKPEFSPKPTAFGARAIIDATAIGSFDYWAINKTGRYYFLRSLDEDRDPNKHRRGKGSGIYFDLRIWRVAEAILHCSNLYRELGLPSATQIALSILHEGLKDRVLGVGAPMRAMQWNRKSEENEIKWSRTLPLGSIEPTLQELTNEACNQLFALFEFWQPSEQVFREIFTEFLNSRI